MTRQNFEVVLRAFLQRQPFRPFTLELVSGSRIEVNHPEALRQHKELIAYRSTAGIQAVFDCTAVIRFIDATGST